MQFTPVSREDIPQTRTREGRVSTQFVKDFLDSGQELAKVVLTSDDKKMESVRATLSNYVRRHELPIKVFTASGALYVERSTEIVAHYQKLNAEAAAKAAAASQAPVAPVENAETEAEVDPAADAANAEA